MPSNLEPDFGDVIVDRDGMAKFVQKVEDGWVYFLNIPKPEGDLPFSQMFQGGGVRLDIWQRAEKTGVWP